MPLPPAAYPWRTVPLREPQHAEGTGLPLVALDLEGARARRQGHTFRSVRVEAGLGLQETAQAFGVSAVEVGDLERGHRLFASPGDFWAALEQLWTWGAAREPGLVAQGAGGGA
ncbi:hypothetical protein [Myxococcus phage Mx4 ts27htf-1hrm-1]|nr:hypothetical protein [Myxococcus phage Mx4 ts27htf-1hrm-1]